MLAKSVLVRPQGLSPRARAPTCPRLATPLWKAPKVLFYQTFSNYNKKLLSNIVGCLQKKSIIFIIHAI